MARILAALALAVCLSGAAAAATPCEEDLAELDRRFDRTIAALDGAAADADARCAVMRRHVETMVAAREVFQRCLADPRQSEAIGEVEWSITLFRDVLGDKCPAE